MERSGEFLSLVSVGAPDSVIGFKASHSRRLSCFCESKNIPLYKKKNTKKKTLKKLHLNVFALIFRDQGVLKRKRFSLLLVFSLPFLCKSSSEKPDQLIWVWDLAVCLGLFFFVGRGGIVTAVDFPSPPLIPLFCFCFSSSLALQRHDSL